jgi:hypothetical protein
MIEYRFRVPSTAVFTLYSYSKTLEYHLEYTTAGSLNRSIWKERSAKSFGNPGTPPMSLVVWTFAGYRSLSSDGARILA